MQLGHSDHTRRGALHQVSLVLDNVHDPLNVGSLFRLSDALGVSHLYLCGRTPVPPHPSIRKMSRGTDSLVPYTYVPEAPTVVQELRAVSTECIALEITSTSTSIYSLTLSAPRVALIVGAEDAGVSDAVLSLVTQHVHIDLDGTQSSMNVAMAAAIGTYEIVRQLRRVSNGTL